MDRLKSYQNEVFNSGFNIINDVYNSSEIENIIKAVEQANPSNLNFHKTDDLFAIRKFLKEVPEVLPLVFNNNLKWLISLFGSGYFIVKSIYFDKPELSNWFVSWHQDLTIAVSKKTDLVGYGPWTVKQDQFGVQPPLAILQDNFTIRIHLDNTGRDNGALKVIPGSHRKGVYRPENIDWKYETETICTVNAGGIMIMRPLLLHSSNRTTNNKKRRVVHIEFSRVDLPVEIDWAEKELL